MITMSDRYSVSNARHTEPLVSVVMVVRDVERFLADAIESVLSQTFRNFELVITDFGSSDRTPKIVSKYAARDSRIRFNSISPCGLAEARNAATRLARGRYIAVMDADDVCVPNRLLWEVEFLEKHPDVGVVGGGTQWIDPQGSPLRIDQFPTEGQEIRAQLAFRCPFCQPAVLLRKDAFLLAGGYREAFAPAEDYDLWLRVSEQCECANLKQVVLNYRIHPHQISMRRTNQQTLGMLAAQASALARRSGKPDPLAGAHEITAATLAELGIARTTIQNTLVMNRQQWVRHMYWAAEYRVALEAALSLLKEDWECVERWQLADLYLVIARLHLKQNEFVKSAAAFGRALTTRPKILGRPLRPLLQRVGLVRRDNPVSFLAPERWKMEQAMTSERV